LYVIAVYDISDVNLQGKVRNFLRRYLLRVQLSVFHGNINPSQLKEIELFFQTIKMQESDSIILFYIPIQTRVLYKVFGKDLNDSRII
jgi:CRISPR-associated endonuclease Cas2